MWVLLNDSLTRLDSYKRVFENKDFYNVIMPSEDIKLLEFNQNVKNLIKHRLLFIQISSV